MPMTYEQHLDEGSRSLIQALYDQSERRPSSW